jgi:ankyrin repeat protein
LAVRDKTEELRLKKCVNNTRRPCIEALFAAGADPTVGGKSIGTGNNVLHHAVRLGDASIISLICEHAAEGALDVDSRGAGGWTPLGGAILHRAASYKLAHSP